MSDNWITVIPEDPGFAPDMARLNNALEWFLNAAPDAEEIAIKQSEEIEFFDCGSNFERVLCPSCRVEISLEWWRQRMDDDHDIGFKLSKYPAPCCRTAQTLHELIYDWPQGFGRHAIDAMNPGIEKLNNTQQRELEQILGTPIRIIYQHI
jgi:hypothetical protein